MRNNNLSYYYKYFKLKNIFENKINIIINDNKRQKNNNFNIKNIIIKKKKDSKNKLKKKYGKKNNILILNQKTIFQNILKNNIFLSILLIFIFLPRIVLNEFIKNDRKLNTNNEITLIIEEVEEIQILSDSFNTLPSKIFVNDESIKTDIAKKINGLTGKENKIKMILN